MSKLTDILGLFQYDPETDGANTFNITQALNNNWDKIDQLVLLAVAAAAAYDPEGSYAVGDYCTHGGKLRKCSTAIPDGEAWNAEHWTETTVAAELSAKANVKDCLSNTAIFNEAAIDVHEAVGLLAVNPSFTSQPSVNVPDGVNWGVCLSMLYGSTRHLLLVENGNLWIQSYTGFQWTDWVKYSTATPPEETALPLLSGVTPTMINGGYKCVFYKDQFNKVHITLGVDGSFPNGTHLFQLPEDCRPDGRVAINAYNESANSNNSFISIDDTGIGILLYDNANTVSTHVFASGDFYAAQ